MSTKRPSNRLCCFFDTNDPEEILGEDARIINELFPFLVNGLTINDEKEGSLCPAFMKSRSISLSSVQGELGMRQQLMISIGQKEEASVVEEISITNVIKEEPSLESNGGSSDTKAKNEVGELIPIRDRQNKKFTSEEDERLKNLVKLYGEGAWSQIAENMKDRNRKQVRERYINFLKKERVVTEFTPEEDALIIQQVQKQGRKWCLISEMLVGRTPIMIKNRYYAKLKKVIDKSKSKNNLTSKLSTSSPSTSRAGSSNEATSPDTKGSKDSFRSEEDDDIEKLRIQEKNMKVALVSIRDKIEKIKNNKGVFD